MNELTISSQKGRTDIFEPQTIEALWTCTSIQDAIDLLGTDPNLMWLHQALAEQNSQTGICSMTPDNLVEMGEPLVPENFPELGHRFNIEGNIWLLNPEGTQIMIQGGLVVIPVFPEIDWEVPLLKSLLKEVPDPYIILPSGATRDLGLWEPQKSIVKSVLQTIHHMTYDALLQHANSTPNYPINFKTICDLLSGQKPKGTFLRNQEGLYYYTPTEGADQDLMVTDFLIRRNAHLIDLFADFKKNRSKIMHHLFHTRRTQNLQEAQQILQYMDSWPRMVLQFLLIQEDFLSRSIQIGNSPN